MRSAPPRFSGRKVVELRHREGINQAELARRARVHQAQLSRWENGQTPGADVVGVLAAALKCDVSELYADGDEHAASDDEDEDSDLFEAAHRLDLSGDYALANRLRARARDAARARSRA